MILAALLFRKKSDLALVLVGVLAMFMLRDSGLFLRSLPAFLSSLTLLRFMEESKDDLESALERSVLSTTGRWTVNNEQLS